MISNSNKTKIISIMEHKNYSIIGNDFIIFPEDVNTIISIVKLANRTGIKIIVIGNGSMFDTKLKEMKNTVYLSTQKLNNIIDLDKNNLFVKVNSGCRYVKLLELLSNESLFFPLSGSVISSTRTAGGIFASMKSYSEVLNYITGIEFVSPDGELIKYGTKTLKNVAGYDLVKFMSGSFGKFGIITSLLMRVFPKGNGIKHAHIEDCCFNELKIPDDELYLKLKNETDKNGVLS